MAKFEGVGALVWERGERVRRCFFFFFFFFWLAIVDEVGRGIIVHFVGVGDDGAGSLPGSYAEIFGVVARLLP